jgi:hypothetical protein
VNIIERVKEIGLDFDHSGHNILYNASKDIINVNGIVCELGLRRGGGLGVMMLGCIDTSNIDRMFIAIDPYGNLLYNTNNNTVVRHDYTNNMKYQTLINLYKFCLDNNILFDLITLEDTEFFKRYKDGIPFYNIDKQIINEYAIVHLDGPHHESDVLNEVMFFSDKISTGGYIVIDDVTYFNMSNIENYLIDHGFILIDNDNQKASYKKV